MSIYNGKERSFFAPNPSLEIQDPEWRLCISNGLGRLWQSQDLFDYTLIAEGRSFPVHRVVLASVSDYFYAMLTSGMKETQQDHVELKAINANMLQLVLDYVYTGILHITKDNVIDLLTAAAHLQISTAIKSCLSFMNANISVDNCVEILDIARLHSYDQDFSHKVEDFVAENLSILIESGNYLKLSFNSMNGLLCREDLVFGPEEKLYQAVVQWLEHEPENRMQFHIGLMKHIRFPLMTTSEVDTIIETHPELMLNPVLNENFKQAQEYLSKPVHQRVLCQNCHTRLRMKPSLLAIREENSWFALNTGKWLNVKSVDFQDICRGRCIVVNDFLLMCGGWVQRRETSAKCYIFDPREYKWTELASMCVPRQDYALVEHKGFLYALAGQNVNDDSYTRTIERYSFVSNHWEVFTEMYPEWVPSPWLSACVLGDRIYTGDGDSEDMDFMPSNPLAFLDICANEWQMAPMKGRQIYGSSMWVQGHLLYATDTCLSSPIIHWHDPRTGDTGSVFCPEQLLNEVRIVTDNESVYFLDGNFCESNNAPGINLCREVVIKEKSIQAINNLDPLPEEEMYTFYCVQLRLPGHQFILNEEDK